MNNYVDSRTPEERANEPESTLTSTHPPTHISSKLEEFKERVELYPALKFELGRLRMAGGTDFFALFTQAEQAAYEAGKKDHLLEGVRTAMEVQMDEDYEILKMKFVQKLRTEAQQETVKEILDIIAGLDEIPAEVSAQYDINVPDVYAWSAALKETRTAISSKYLHPTEDSTNKGAA